MQVPTEVTKEEPTVARDVVTPEDEPLGEDEQEQEGEIEETKARRRTRRETQVNFSQGGLPSLRKQYALEPGGLLVFSLVRINVHITVWQEYQRQLRSLGDSWVPSFTKPSTFETKALMV